ncbi:Endonuclease/exonuclease/phosphatase [Lophiotrema nucula]|uniref:Endonuclease/exonuclease/phosphatase n=1 Tax=Lophiotrema nucula TaxID=690887 RepID=A0A6A5Z3K3_9PLEO|nr:Endonuclease/exonuclease/phosphatase [Lophiotrema nucula]
MFELYLLTFNCARNLVNPETLAPPLFDALPSDAPVPDILAISLQEIAPIAYSFLGGSFLTPYYDQLTATVQLAAKLRSHGNETLEHVATRSLGMTALMLFAKPQVAERIQWIQSAGAGVGVWNMGNKGAVAMRIGVSSRSTDEVLPITFTAAHLAPMEGNVEARNEDWKNIVSNLVFINNDSSGYSSAEEVPLLASPAQPPPDDKGLFIDGSPVFFAGDLNYRTSDQPPNPKSHHSYPQPAQSDSSARHYSHLLKQDQLNREKEAHRTLHGLEELPVDFPPTYKYSTKEPSPAQGHKRTPSTQEDEWRWAKHRYPSWCDRILYLPASHSSRKLEAFKYTALPVQATSDHRPVALSVRLDEERVPVSRPFEAPFPINPDWRPRRDSARRLEVIVGILSYLALTKKGNAMIVAVFGVAFASWWAGVHLAR